jgi:hypothetical protein
MKAVLESPARRELLARLLRGDSAVWIMVESGDKERDDAQAEVLLSTLKDLGETLALPELREGPEDQLTNKTVPFRLGFSALRVSRTDPAEESLVRMLLRGAGGPAGLPAAFPVFGRGRALPGTEITAEAIRKNAQILVAPAGSPSKSSVPGVDLLLKADWTGLVGEVPGKVTDIPPGAMLPLQRPEEEFVVDPGSLDRSSPRYQTFWLLAAAGVIFGILLLSRTRRKGVSR